MFGKYRIEQEYVRQEAREIPVAGKFDVVVAGGGPAGLGAAVAAARQGARTLLIERNGFLGGTATAAMMTTFNCPVDRLSGFAREMVVCLLKEGGAWEGPTIPFDPEKFKEVALAFLWEAGASLLLYSWVTEPLVEAWKVRGVVVENKSGRTAYLADVVVDATGDADLAARAGAEVVKGREADGKMRPMTILFRMGGVDIPRLVEYARDHPEQFTADPSFQLLDIEKGVVRISGFFDLVAAARERGELDEDCHYIRFEGVNVRRGTVFVNSTRVYGVDGTNGWDLTRAEIEARDQMRQLESFIRGNLPGCERAYVLDASSSIGVRETRRVRGSFVLSEEDILAQRSYEDTVAKIWRFHAAGRDWHSPDGGEGSPVNAVYRTAVTPLNWFEIPYRCLVPNGVEGLLVGGRTISQLHQADMWTRGMYCCMVTGQAAGTAAALSVKGSVEPRELEVMALQERLAAQGVDLGSRAR
ncbi:MAG: FAD-dependent oxidoreductase [Chloroflexi bacterium]|nr:FAD-dependent oxidoreductase [Chloroflexota bacterium]